MSEQTMPLGDVMTDKSPTTDLPWATRVLGAWVAFAHSVTDELVCYKIECSDLERSMRRDQWTALPIYQCPVRE